MINARARSKHTPAWQRELARAFRDPAELLARLELDPALAARRGPREFPLRVPRGYVARMAKGDIADPLLRQVLPLEAEDLAAAGFSSDPVGDIDALAAPGLLHKYYGRVLLVTTGACAVHCRYCFRRHFPYAEASVPAHGWEPALEYIAADASIAEAILSGGDPLSLTDNRLAALADGLATIAHVERLRLHTRQPVVLPERVDARLLAWLRASRLHKIVVIHANHANELDASVAKALGRLRDAGCTLLNQAVLLRGVNDSVEALARLSEALFTAGVLPYYLHLLDPVQGAAHYAVAERDAARLMTLLAERLPGYLVPRLAREQAGAPAKRVVAPYSADI